MTDRSKTVVMLIDWDNLQICHSRDAPGTDLDLHALIALAQSYGTLVSARAYAEWNLLSERLAVYKAGIEPVFAPVMRPEGSAREGKSLADTVMVADGVDLLWTVAPDVFVLVTSDKDMIPLARIAKQRGAAVVVLGSDLTAIPLVEMSNVFITYRQLLRELDRVVELEAPSGRAPARERRLRESRRPSSEPYTGSGPIGTQGQLGSATRPTSRTVSRPVALHGATRTVEPALPRRSAGTIAPPEGGRSLAGPASDVPTPTAEPVDTEELTPLAASDATPRRRRRRGGRGRRSGTDSPGGSETLGLENVGDVDEPEAAEAADRQVASAPPVDDLDSAVLELLASRDRASDTPLGESPADSGAAEGRTAADQAQAAPTETPAPVTETTIGRRPVRRRPITTTFSEFGPPRAPLTQSTPEPIVETSTNEAESVMTEPEAVMAVPDQGVTAEATVPDTAATSDAAPLNEADALGASASEAKEAEVAPVGAGASTETPQAANEVVASTAENGLATAENGQVTSEEPASDADEARPARRRRTRRPTTRTSSKSKAKAPAEASMAVESGT